MMTVPFSALRSTLLLSSVATVMSVSTINAATMQTEQQSPTEFFGTENNPFFPADGPISLGDGELPLNAPGGQLGSIFQNDGTSLLPDAETFKEFKRLRDLSADRPSIEVQRAIATLSQTGTEEALENLRALLNDSQRNAGGWAYLAIWAAENGRADLAAEANATARDLDPANTLTKLSTAVLQQMSGDLSGAAATLTEITTKSPSNMSAAARLHEIYLQQGQLSAAVSTLETLISATGTDRQTAPFTLRLAQMQVDLRSYGRALVHLDAYLQLPSLTPDDSLQAMLLAARAAIGADDLVHAETLLSNPDGWQDHVDMAATLTAALEWRKGASAQAEKQLQKLKDDPKVGLLATRYLGQIAFQKGEPIQGTGYYTAAINRTQGLMRLQIVEEAVAALDASDLQSEADNFLVGRLHELGVVGHIMLSDRQLKQERHMAALMSSSAGLVSFPNESELRYLRGMSNFMMGKDEEAKTDFDLATGLNPDHARAWVSLAKLSHNRGGHGGPGRHEEVIATYEKALERSPNNAIIQIEMGKVAHEEARPEAAEEWFRAALVSAPSDPIAQSLLAILLIEMERIEEAASLTKLAMNSMPGHHQVLFAKGRTDLARGDVQSASEMFIAANQSRPEHGHSLAYASVALEKGGSADRAAEVAQKALHLMLRDDEVSMARAVLTSVLGSNSVEIPLNRVNVDGVFESFGTMAMMDTPMGMKLDIALSGVEAGNNFIHLHENPSCSPGYKDGVLVAGLSAGAHLGATQTGSGGHAHHMAMAQDSEAGAKAPMETYGPMVMTMDHGMHKMDMVMRSGDLPIGDLPALTGDETGTAKMSVFVPYLHTSMLENRSVVVHKGMDAARAYCGVIKNG